VETPQLLMVEAWAATPDDQPARSPAIKRLVEIGLKGKMNHIWKWVRRHALPAGRPDFLIATILGLLAWEKEMGKTPGEFEPRKPLSKEEREARKALRDGDAKSALTEHANTARA
jgi:hypothetical protein